MFNTETSATGIHVNANTTFNTTRNKTKRTAAQHQPGHTNTCIHTHINDTHTYTAAHTHTRAYTLAP